MAKVIALARTVPQDRLIETLRATIVCGCALALILAHPLPFFG